MTTDFSVFDAIQFNHLLQGLATGEREAQVEFLIALAEFDRRNLYLELGYESLWSFCLDGLHFDEGQVNLRTRAIRLMRRFPIVTGALRTGRLSLSTLVMLAPVLTEANAPELVERAAWKTKAQVEHIVVSIRPIEIKQEGFRQMAAAPTPAPVPPAADDEPLPIVAPAPTPPPPPRAFQPIAADWTLVRWRLRSSTVETVKRAADIASHRIEPGDWDALLAEMARVFYVQEEKRIAGATDRPRKSRGSRNNRYIPRPVRRAVWARDQGACTFVGLDGRRCNSRFRVQYHHKHPAGQGGPATVDNICLRCSRHNQYEADLVYGKDFMDTKRDPAAT